ncbi:MAG: UDP-N-acetylmuramate dehydrogenase [Oscillospiraceae bacterium]|nr:UDP-N-acetylmuramate dehydrogenase [Oscillospiraceae bacterium]
MSELTSLQKNFPAVCELKYQEPMSRHTSFRIGGAAEVMAFPKDKEEMAAVLKASAELGVVPAVLGAGTNVLAPDTGMRGIVICLKDCLDGMELLEDGRIRVMAGVTMTRAAVFAANHGLSGLEFAHGIPGTVGGGVYMNAGAYGGEICQICESVEIMEPDGNVKTLSNQEMGFSYRHSVLEETPSIVISAVFRLTGKPAEEIRARMKELMSKRSASQPLELPSAGSAFKRPVGGYAAALIDQAGLRGYQVGGAAISAKHAGFAVNLGGATAADVRALLGQVSDIVYEHSGIRLEPEVRIW